jgi:hypothetical protein
MAGTIVADTLTHSTAGSLDTNYVVSNTIKVWGYLNGDNTTLYDSFGLSSVSDEAAGDINFTMTNAMANTNYACIGASGQDVDVEIATNFCANNGTRTTTVFQVGTGYATSAAHGAADRDVVCPAILGDLA